MVSTYREAAKLAKAAAPDTYGPEGLYVIVAGLEDDTDYHIQCLPRPGVNQNDVPLNSSFEFVNKSTGEVWFAHFSEAFDKIDKMRPAK